MRYGRRATTAVALAAAAAITLTGCGGGRRGARRPTASRASSSGTSGDAGEEQGGSTPSATPTQILAQIKGEQDVDGRRSTPPCATPAASSPSRASITNNGTRSSTPTRGVGHGDRALRSGASVAGAVLVDEAGKKRYYVLRDTDGRCLCTMGLVGIQPNETRPFFAQFPSPPETTTDVEFELPTMPPAKISISEG